MTKEHDNFSENFEDKFNSISDLEGIELNCMTTESYEKIKLLLQKSITEIKRLHGSEDLVEEISTIVEKM